MSSQALPRSGLVQPFEGYPAYGAVHDVIPNEQLRNFLFDFSRVADQVFQKSLGEETLFIDNRLEDEIDTNTEKAIDSCYDPRLFYKIFDIETLGVSAVEMDPAAKQARAVRAIWEKQDFGAVEQEARNEMGRRLPDVRPQLMFNRVQGAGKRLPNVSKTEVRQKLALLPDPVKFPETISLINEEADIVIRAIRSRLKQFTYPWDEFPHLTFSVFRTAAEPDQIDEIVENTNKFLAKNPFGVRLGDIGFRYKSERTKR